MHLCLQMRVFVFGVCVYTVCKCPFNKKKPYGQGKGQNPWDRIDSYVIDTQLGKMLRLQCIVFHPFMQ